MKLTFTLYGQIAGWAWMIIAGGGGLWLLVTRGPWPPTNGWFALASGIAACPLVGWSLKKYARIDTSIWLQLAVALVLFLAGHLALTIWPHS
jgi:hypothetical protein